jgi:hypothetical protein
VILLVNPRATRPKNRRFPLSLMNLGAALPPEVTWEIVDANRPSVDPLAEISARVRGQERTGDPVRAIAMTVMPGPQLVSAVPLAKELKRRFPHVPMVWGGYFPSLYPAPVLNAPYVDWAIRGQGEHSFRSLLDVVDGRAQPGAVPGLAYRAERGWDPTSSPIRRTTRSRSTITCTRPSWARAAASTRPPSAVRSGASSAA